MCVCVCVCVYIYIVFFFFQFLPKTGAIFGTNHYAETIILDFSAVRFVLSAAYMHTSTFAA